MKKSALTKQEIDKAAAVCFFRHGYAATTMRAVAEAAGLPVSLLYYYYPSKEEIFAGVFRAEIDTLFKTVFARVDLWSPRPVAEIIADIIWIRTPDKLSDYELYLHRIAYSHWLGTGESSALREGVAQVFAQSEQDYGGIMANVRFEGIALAPVAVDILYIYINYRIMQVIFGKITFDREKTVREIEHLLRTGVVGG